MIVVRGLRGVLWGFRVLRGLLLLRRFLRALRLRSLLLFSALLPWILLPLLRVFLSLRLLLLVSLLPFRFQTLPLLLLTLLLPSRLVLRTFWRILLTLSLAFLTLVHLWLFRTPFVQSFVGWWLLSRTFFRKRLVLRRFLLLLALFSKTFSPLLLLLLLQFSWTGSGESALLWRRRTLVLPVLLLLVWGIFFFFLHGLPPMRSMGISPWGVRLQWIPLYSLFEHRLKPSNHVGMSIREAAALEASLRSQSEAFSHSIWVLSALLAFVRLQNFVPEDSSLFNTLVTSLSRSLAHQASLTATHTAFVGLKRRTFYLSSSSLLFWCQ